MYEFRGFTQKANKALNLSIESAQNFGHDYIGTEHILLGLIKEGSGVAAAALEECGVTAEALEKEIANVDGRGIQTSLSPDSFTPRTKRVLRTAMMISARTGSSYVGTEHILLAIVFHPVCNQTCNENNSFYMHMLIEQAFFRKDFHI